MTLKSRSLILTSLHEDQAWGAICQLSTKIHAPLQHISLARYKRSYDKVLCNEMRTEVRGACFQVWPISSPVLTPSCTSPFLRMRLAIIKAILEDLCWRRSRCDELGPSKTETDSSTINISNLEHTLKLKKKSTLIVEAITCGLSLLW